MTSRVVGLLLVLVVLGVAGCDQASKGWAADRLAGKSPSVLVRGGLDLEYAENHGVAFNVERALPAAVRTPLVVALGIALTVGLGLAWWRRRGELSAHTVGFALVLGGAAGNLIDRFARGFVVDFIHVHGYPIFNVADIAVVAGAGLLIIGGAASRSRPTASPPRPPSAA